MKNNPAIIIRKARLSDLATLQQLSSELLISAQSFDPHQRSEWSHSENGKKYLLRRIRGRKGACFVAEINKEIVGYCTGGILPVQN